MRSTSFGAASRFPPYRKARYASVKSATASATAPLGTISANSAGVNQLGFSMALACRISSIRSYNTVASPTPAVAVRIRLNFHRLRACRHNPGPNSPNNTAVTASTASGIACCFSRTRNSS